MTRFTYLQRRWPDTPLFQDIAHRWCKDQSRLLLALVWQGYDLLCREDLQKVPFHADDEAKEESLNFLLTLRIDRCKSGDEPFAVSHQPPEQTKRKHGPGRSPQPDIAFCPYSHPRSVWPMEGKVLHHEGDLAAYLEEIGSNLLTGRYATFSREAAMLGYLLQGDPDATLGNIAARMTERLLPHPSFRDRPHRVSEHERDTSADPEIATTFWCHHLIMHVAAA